MLTKEEAECLKIHLRRLQTDKRRVLTELTALLKLDSENLNKIKNKKREFNKTI